MRDERECFEGLHHAQVIGRMHDRAGTMGHEAKFLKRHMLAIEFREIAEHATAEPDSRKGFLR